MPAGRPLQPGDPAWVGAYRLTARLGQGGQGVVYLGFAPDGTPVAIKVLGAEWAGDAGFRRRFEREARAARQVASFCTAQVLDASFDVAQPYIVSEYVEGPPLKDEVEHNGPRSGADLHRLAVATATALVAVHEAGIVHRDFKPANVLLAPQGPRVIDFGIAQTGDVTGAQTQSVIGTPGYMAPEQIAGEALGPAVDVFAWGAVMVFAATGRAPFSGDSIPAVIHQVMSATPDLSGMEEPWASVTARCLAKDPAQRPSSAELLMRLLGRRDGSGDAPLPGAAALTPPHGPHPVSPPHPPVPGQPGGHAAPVPGPGSPVPAADHRPTDPTDPTDPTAPDAEAHAAGARNGRGRKRSARRSLAVAGAAVALLLVVGAGGYGAWAAASSGPDADGVAPGGQDPVAAAPSVTGSPSPSADPSPSASSGSPAQAEVEAEDKPSGKPSPGDSGGNGDGEPEVSFSSEFAGRWVGEGTFPNQTQRNYTLVIEDGSRNAALTTSDNACTWRFTLFRTNNKGGFDGSMNTGAGCGPHKGGGFWIDGGRLVVMLWGEQGNFKPHFFWLDRP